MRIVCSLGVVAAGAVLALALAGCGGPSAAGGSSAPTGSGSGRAPAEQLGGVSVVASTNVYGDLARQVGGEGVKVQSIITDPSQDPHSYEANTRTQLALSKADIVIVNGGGYDDFVDRMLGSAGKTPEVINVVQLSDKTAPQGGELNEHVWYDFPTVQKLVTALVTRLSAADGSGAATYRANGAALSAKLAALESTEASIRSGHAGAGVAITEPVPLYLLQACGLVNKTPASFSTAVEEGSGVPVQALNDTLELFKAKAVTLLAFNEQTSSPETEKVLAAAKANGVPVLPVTETLPAGTDYVSWMTSNLDAVQAALS